MNNKSNHFSTIRILVNISVCLWVEKGREVSIVYVDYLDCFFFVIPQPAEESLSNSSYEILILSFS